jgi:hypothetical protein
MFNYDPEVPTINANKYLTYKMVLFIYLYELPKQNHGNVSRLAIPTHKKLNDDDS